MKTTLVREVTLYRYRYVVGYVVFGLLLLALLLLGIDQAPRGLTHNEMDSAVTSVRVNIFHPAATNVVDAPYHILQKTSIQLVGLTSMAIKLPSIVIGAITGVGIILMLQKWFRKNVAILTAMIIVTSAGFLSLARTGTPLIMTAFWTVLLLLGSTHVLYAEKHRFLWKLFCFIAIALLAYSPFGVYPLLVMVIAGIIHPHVRIRLRQGRWWQHMLAVITVLLVLAPLIVAMVYTPSIGLQLIGLDRIHEFSIGQIIPTALGLASTLFNFTHTTAELVPKPLFGLATAALLVLGLLKLFTASYSARSYMIFIWIVFLIPVMLLRPDMILLIIVPATLILAIGIETLIRQWYDLFPRNPYARITALIPLSILLISIVGINVERYFYGYHYSSEAGVFHAELPALRSTLDRQHLGRSTPVTVIVPQSQQAFYDLLRREYPRLSIASDQTRVSGARIVLNSVKTSTSKSTPSLIVTSDLSHADQSVLLRYYRS